MSESKKTAYEKFREAFEKNTVTDRIDQPYLLLQQIQLINMMRADSNIEAERVDQAIQSLCDMIADDVRDKQFNEDLEQAYDEVITDMRNLFCGVRVGAKTPMNQRKEKIMNHSKQFHAIVNLNQRLGLGLKTENKGFVGKIEE